MTHVDYWICSNRPFEGRVASNPEELERLLTTHELGAPSYIFFPFWSWKVPDKVLKVATCIGFHSAPLPKGKGGSPIQNMIRLGYDSTIVCMFYMKSGLDGGGVIRHDSLSLKGTLSEIVDRIRVIILDMIANPNRDIDDEYVTMRCWPIEIPEHFDRITDNKLPETEDIVKLYDEIRMRDEEGHPKAYIWHGRYKIDFSNVKLAGGRLKAEVEIYES